MSNFIFGCGDLGRRIAKQLISHGIHSESISSFVRSQKSAELASGLRICVERIDVDHHPVNLTACHQQQIYFSVAPQNHGAIDLRSRPNIGTRQIILYRISR